RVRCIMKWLNSIGKGSKAGSDPIEDLYKLIGTEIYIPADANPNGISCLERAREHFAIYKDIIDSSMFDNHPMVKGGFYTSPGIYDEFSSLIDAMATVINGRLPKAPKPTYKDIYTIIDTPRNITAIFKDVGQHWDRTQAIIALGGFLSPPDKGAEMTVALRKI